MSAYFVRKKFNFIKMKLKKIYVESKENYGK